MNSPWQDTFAYLSDRGADNGITADELIASTPTFIQHDPHAVMSFWQQKDISHILPTSRHPELAGDFNNWIPEDPGPNNARQDQIMSWYDHAQAQLDNFLDAYWLS
ncbi:hypothetical protein KBY86_02195 [Synechococcus sp. Lug-A]|uniref:hypothetical protein n=1 Tax=Synechococcus sp. Lug-A TaxID=2823740 RepID=UPI0020CD695D|nr:hypothetical protein [Synechococcus sp. Lug-A]MCP9845708.1 hypothetical protein [Synechococcus sp. Lug-A]